MENRSLTQRILALVSVCAAIWVFTYVAGPMLVNASQDFRTLGDFIVRENIDTGMFYYTDLEIVGHADHNARSTIEYMPHGPGPLPGVGSATGAPADE
ncbi:hypothetical protein [uncultured Pseudodesulfovibrio sp.]|uniref:hypothetical protein n=1 Tax=uncultured Pseudodesulfovibrio sp. TaxID=2035858 RepID=UPI0029C7F90E|nr:hypothetical protein [uncultured Pseudodesulfovibrio sp.]